nr:MAG TPA: hypothetical protein [Caudoviricetes sp.]
MILLYTLSVYLSIGNTHFYTLIFQEVPAALIFKRPE